MPSTPLPSSSPSELASVSLWWMPTASDSLSGRLGQDGGHENRAPAPKVTIGPLTFRMTTLLRAPDTVTECVG